MTDTTDLSIVIVAFRSYDKLNTTLAAVFASRTSYSYEVIVVDNGSGDGTAERIEKDFPAAAYPNLRLIRNANNGFSKGNNFGIRESRGEYVLVLNPDTAVSADTIQICMDHIRRDSEIGALGCKLVKEDRQLDPACRRSFPNPAAAFYRLSGLQKLFPRSAKFAAYNLSYLPEDEIADVDAISGAFMLMPRAVLDQVGMFDEEYFMYGEDLDLCWKIKHAGYRVVYYPATTTIHYKGQSSRKAPYITLYHFHEAMAIFYRKHYAADHGRLMNWLVYAGIWLRFAVKYARTLMWLKS